MEKIVKFELKTAKNREQWDDFVTSHPEANFLQSWDFYEFHQSRGNDVVRRIAVDEQRNIVAAYAGVVEAAKRGRHLAIAGGPVLDWGNLELVEAVFQDMREQGKKENCVFVRVRPQLERSESSLKLMQNLGAKPAPMYLSVEFAGVLDLNKSEEELLAGMRQRLRRALRKAAKNGITVEKSTNPEDIHEFYQIQMETAGRHGFVAFSEDFFLKQFTALAKNGEAVLYSAKYQGETLAQNFMIFYGNEASYHYGNRHYARNKIRYRADQQSRANTFRRHRFFRDAVIVDEVSEHCHRYHDPDERYRSIYAFIPDEDHDKRREHHKRQRYDPCRKPHRDC